ncbi:hypothetical protein VTJ04DRAFT_10306 [Mycothermus thermophilus]|uniref:uncharacterized protein n=1 Tax=Humicola insolens TaxID=85995 RepID=UPI003742AF00
MSDIRKAEAKDAPEFEAKVEAMIEAKDAPKVKDEVEAKNEKPWNVNGKMLPVVPFTGKTYFFPSHFPGVEHFTAYCMNAVVKFGVSDELKELLDDCDRLIILEPEFAEAFSMEHQNQRDATVIQALSTDKGSCPHCACDKD